MIQFVTDKKGISLDLSMYKNELPIYGDYEKLARVITNLIDNAIKYGAQEDGHIWVRVDKSGESRLEISVMDDGPGIPADKKEQVFDRFVQVDRHVGPGKHGTGLGLAISR